MKIKTTSPEYKKMHDIIRAFINSGDFSYPGIETTYKQKGLTSTRAVWDLWHAATDAHKAKLRNTGRLFSTYGKAEFGHDFVIDRDSGINDSHITSALKHITGIKY